MTKASAYPGRLLDKENVTRALQDDRTWMAAAAVAVAGVAAATGSRARSELELTATTTVQKSPEEVYAFWRRLENLPTFMAHVEEVTVHGSRSHWRVAGPLGDVEWDAETTEDQPGRMLAWRSVGKTKVPNQGAVRLVPAPGGRGTEVHVTLRYDLPGGSVGKAFARFFGEEPHQQIADDLRRFKQVMETGEVIRSDGAPYGKLARAEFPQHAAQPLTAKELRKEARA